MPTSESPLCYLISNSLPATDLLKVINLLSSTPVDVIIAAPQDVSQARQITEQVTGLHRPIAIMANFDTPLQAVERDGAVGVIHL